MPDVAPETTAPLPDAANTSLSRLRLAAEAGNAHACLQLGHCYARGWSTPIKLDAALRWYLSAARAGITEAAFCAATCSLQSGPVKPEQREAILALLLAAAKSGHADSQALLGWFYQCGYTVRQSAGTAVAWYRLSATSGSAAGRFNLAMCLCHGYAVPVHEREAVELLELAAEQGHARAQLNLGRILSEGKMAPRDGARALYWYRQAAERGYAKAQYNLGLLLAGGEFGDNDDEEAANWIALAAEQGLAKAQMTLASLYRRGIGVPHDPQAAHEWLLKAATAGYAKAQYRLSRLLARDRQNKQNCAAARIWLGRAADNGHAGAQYEFARQCLRDGDAHKLKLAFTCLLQASASGHTEATYYVGVCYYKGCGVMQDYRRAYAYFEQARAGGSQRGARAAEKLRHKIARQAEQAQRRRGQQRL